MNIAIGKTLDDYGYRPHGGSVLVLTSVARRRQASLRVTMGTKSLLSAAFKSGRYPRL